MAQNPLSKSSTSAPNRPPRQTRRPASDHLQRRRVVAGVGGAGAVRLSITHSKPRSLASRMVVCTHVGRDAGEDGLRMPRVQHQLQVRRAEAALAGLVDDGLAGDGVELGNDVPARLAAHQDAATGGRRRRCPPFVPICCERQRLLAGRSARSGRWPSRVWITCMPTRIARRRAAPSRAQSARGQRRS